MTLEEFDVMFTKQDGLCAICHKQPARYIDHVGNKKLGTLIIRGLLCLNCNTMLGQAQENPTILLAAVAYLNG
jgi:Recombination endonuclease VII